MKEKGRSLLLKSDLLELQTSLSGIRFISEDTFAGVHTISIGIGSLFMLSITLSTDAACEGSIRFSQDARNALDESEFAIACALYSGSMGCTVTPPAPGSSEVLSLSTVSCEAISNVPSMVQDASSKLHRIERVLKQLNTIRSRMPNLISAGVSPSNGPAPYTLDLGFINLSTETKVIIKVSLPQQTFAREWSQFEVDVLAGSPACEMVLERSISSLKSGYGWLWRMCTCVDDIIGKQ